MTRERDLERIEAALETARGILARFTPGEVQHRRKTGGDPVTEADTAVNEALRLELPRRDEGWLSEETTDEPARLACQRVWVVDPLDGTREFVQGIPEWCVSVALVEAGRAVAGGICNPAAGQTIVGAAETGVRLNGQPCRARSLASLAGREVLASRSEVERGEWGRFDAAPFRVRPMGSVAYKLALVAAGLADATWTLVPKHEWDVAAGVALVGAAGGEVSLPDGSPPVFNRRRPRLPGLLAAAAGLAPAIREVLDRLPRASTAGGG
jgi:myo-inositol-1(or 4)-monophosphatase